MHLKDIFEINLEEFTSKKLSLPATPSSYIETVTTEELWDNVNHKIEHNALPFARSKLLQLPIKSSRVLCNGDAVKKVVELVLDTKHHEIDFLPGDTIGILPTNKLEDVTFLLTTLDMLKDTEQVLQISIMKDTQKKAAKLPIYIPPTTTCQNLLKYYLNIYSIPKKLFVRALVDHTSDANERFQLQILCSKEGAEVYNRYFVEKRLNFLDLLKMCPSCKPSIGVLIEHLPRLLPRPYSIANSSLKSPKEMKVVFSILTDESQKGLMTGELEEKAELFLSDKDNPQAVSLYFREENNFKYAPDDLDRNIIMIGVGCAVAPFLGFLEHKSELEKDLKGLANRNYETWLFSGSRYRRNALYRNEFHEFLKEGVLNEYFESYSRESGYEFKYVQDQIIANAERFVNLLKCPETKLYICADGNEISKKITECIADCLKSVCNITDTEANEVMKDIRKSCRLIEDVWL